jgi:hypothetical protein
VAWRFRADARTPRARAEIRVMPLDELMPLIRAVRATKRAHAHTQPRFRNSVLLFHASAQAPNEWRRHARAARCACSRAAALHAALRAARRTRAACVACALAKHTRSSAMRLTLLATKRGMS